METDTNIEETAEHFAEVEVTLEQSDTLEKDEHAIGRVTNVQREPLKREENAHVLVYTITINGVQHKAIVPEHDGLPNAADTYPSINSISDLAAQRVPVRGTSKNTVAFEEFNYSTDFTSGKTWWPLLQEGKLKRHQDGSYQPVDTGNRVKKAGTSLGLLWAAWIVATIPLTLMGLHASPSLLAGVAVVIGYIGIFVPLLLVDYIEQKIKSLA